MVAVFRSEHGDHEVRIDDLRDLRVLLSNVGTATVACLSPHSKHCAFSIASAAASYPYRQNRIALLVPLTACVAMLVLVATMVESTFREGKKDVNSVHTTQAISMRKW